MTRFFSKSEFARWGLLLLAGAWLLHPFASSRLIGTGDALWYANMLGDFVTQRRAGVFPVFIGQTDLAFNGAVYPLRVAPLYQHLAGTVDLVTGQRFGFYTLQHACVLICGFAGLFATYFSLAAMNPGGRWPACLLAILFLSCPGVLGTIYTQDLYMTWMTLPFLSLAVCGVVRSYEKDDLLAQGLIAGSLAALWLAHAPVALWMTFIVAASQVLRLGWFHRRRESWRFALIGAAVFALLAHYPFVSVASLDVPGAPPAVPSGLAESERIMDAIRGVFPAVLRPVSENARGLGDLQLGYAWWAALIFGAIVAWRRGTSWPLRLLVAGCLGLLLLLTPVPGLTEWLWAHLPGQVVRITYYWPMHRFYLLLAVLLAAVVQLGWRHLEPRWQRLLMIGLILGCGWSLWESRQFIRAGRERTASLEATLRSQRPENRLLMNHAYGLFPELPAYFSNGVMDHRAESRLLDLNTLAPLAPANAPEPTARFSGVIDANPGVVVLRPTLRLEPDKRYELRFAFDGRDYAGILQFAGPTFFRQYILPQSGKALAFGSQPGNSPSLWLWTTASTTEEVTVRFIPTGPGARAGDYLDFAGFTLREANEAAIAVQTKSLLPYRAAVRAPAAAWLETPRMFIDGYTATVNGQPREVRRSPRGLVMMPVDPDAHEVALTYPGPWLLRLSYFATWVAWALLGVGGVFWHRPGRRPGTEPLAASH